jgi:signal transduction histidine kinase
MTPQRRLVTALASAAVAAFGIAALIEARRHGDQALGGASTRELALQLGVGLGLWAAGVAVVVRGSALLAGALLAAAGPALFLGELPLPAAGGAVLFTAALAGGATASTLACAGALFHIQRFRLVPDGLVAGVTVGVVVVWAGVLPAVTFDPSAGGCFSCPRNLLLIHGNSGVHDDLVRTGMYAAAASTAALALLTGVRWARSWTPMRGTAAAVGIAGAVSAGLAAAAFTHEARSGTPLLDSTTHFLWLAECVTLGILSVGVAAESVRTRLLSHRITSLVIEAVPSADDLQAVLGASVGDHDLQIVFPRADGSPVDGEGRPVQPVREGTVVTDVLRGREVVAQLRHAPELGPMVGRFDEAARSAGLALEHASSRARLRSELAELSASRSRIVELGDAERRRLERDLHDGAQQRLIALSVALQQTASRPMLTRARGEILAALDELRVLAHGIFPASLTDAGLDAALRELADSSRVPLRLDTVPHERLSQAVETAAYRLVLDGAHCAERHGDGRAVSTAIEVAAGSLRLALRIPGVDATTASLNLEHAFDRVAALDGTTSIASSVDGVVVKASVPCG